MPAKGRMIHAAPRKEAIHLRSRDAVDEARARGIENLQRTFIALAV